MKNYIIANNFVTGIAFIAGVGAFVWYGFIYPSDTFPSYSIGIPIAILIAECVNGIICLMLSIARNDDTLIGRPIILTVLSLLGTFGMITPITLAAVSIVQ